MFVSRVTVLEQAEHMYLNLAVHQFVQHRECMFTNQIQFKRNFANRLNKFATLPHALVRMGNAKINR